MAEKKKNAAKLVAKVNKEVCEVEFIRPMGAIKVGQKAKFGATTALDFYVKGYVKMDLSPFPDTKKFVEANKEEVKGLQDAKVYD